MFLGVTWVEWYFCITVAYFISNFAVGGEEE